MKHELFVDTNIFLRFLTNDDPIKANLNTPHPTCSEAPLIRRALDLYSPGSILKPITFGEPKQDPTQAVSI